MNASHTQTAELHKPGTIHKPSKRLADWGLPIGVRDLDGIQKMHDARRNLNFLHQCLQMASWFHDTSSAPQTADGNIGHALCYYNLPCGARLAIWIPTMIDSEGKIAVYMSGCVGKQDIAAIECAHVLLEIRRAMGG